MLKLMSLANHRVVKFNGKEILILFNSSPTKKSQFKVSSFVSHLSKFTLKFCLVQKFIEMQSNILIGTLRP